MYMSIFLLSQPHVYILIPNKHPEGPRSSSDSSTLVSVHIVSQISKSAPLCIVILIGCSND